MNSDNISSVVVKVFGMSCGNCEKEIDSSLSPLEGVISSKSDFVKGIVRVEFNSELIDINSILSVIESDAGYQCRVKDSVDIKTVVTGAITVAVLFIVWRSGVINIIPEVESSMGYPLIFIVGLMTSLHCVGMCGAINLSQTIKDDNSDKKSPILKRGIKYNLGRLTSYTVLGGIVGGIGSVLSLSITLQGIVIIIAALFMLVMGFNMLGLFSFLRKFVPKIPSSLGNNLKRATKNSNPYVIGLVNGFLPCGPLQSMQLYALSTGSILRGALSMFLFSAGTIPLMLAFGTFGALFSKKNQQTILKVSGVIIIFLGITMFGRGLSLNGISLISGNNNYVSTSDFNGAVAVVDGSKQTVVSQVFRSSYEPIVVQKGLPVKWILNAEPGTVGGCNNAIIVRDFGIRQSLSVGETVVEFTPEISGTYNFSCWMGMINSKIYVVDDINSIDKTAIEEDREEYNGGPVELTIPTYSVEDIVTPTIVDDLQFTAIVLNENGFEKPIIVLQKGISTKWTFDPQKLTDKNYRITFPYYNAQLDFPTKDIQIIDLEPNGDFYFYSWKGDYLGFVIIVEDINSFNKEEVIDRVKSYLPE